LKSFIITWFNLLIALFATPIILFCEPHKISESLIFPFLEYRDNNVWDKMSVLSAASRIDSTNELQI